LLASSIRNFGDFASGLNVWYSSPERPKYLRLGWTVT
jgi:hypothetical protein